MERIKEQIAPFIDNPHLFDAAVLYLAEDNKEACILRQNYNELWELYPSHNPPTPGQLKTLMICVQNSNRKMPAIKKSLKAYLDQLTDPVLRHIICLILQPASKKPNPAKYFKELEELAVNKNI